MSAYPYPPEPVDMLKRTDGPWKAEPSAANWVDSRTGLNCAMIRHGVLGTWCGYVAVPEGHPLHGKSYSDSVQVPMTFMDRFFSRELNVERDIGFLNMFLATIDPDRALGDQGHIALVLVLPAHQGLSYASPDDDGAWWFGFDCAHGGDFMPSEIIPPKLMKNWVYRDHDYVYGITMRLAWAIDELRQVIEDDPIDTKYQAENKT